MGIVVHSVTSFRSMDATGVLVDMIEKSKREKKGSIDFNGLMSALEKKVGPVTVEYTENGRDLLYVTKSNKKYFRETTSDPLELALRKAVDELKTDTDPSLVFSDPWRVMLSVLDSTGDGVYTGKFSAVEIPMKRVVPSSSLSEMSMLFRRRVLTSANEKLVELRKALSAKSTGAKPDMHPIFNDLSKKPTAPSENSKNYERELKDYNQKVAVWNVNNSIMKMTASLGILYSHLEKYKAAKGKYMSRGEVAKTTEDTRNLLHIFQYAAGDQKDELSASLPKLDVHETQRYNDKFFDMNTGWASWRDPPITITAFHN